MDRATGPAILFISRVAFLGGAERILLHCMQVAAANGYRPLLACPADGALPEAARCMGFEVLPCAFNRMKSTVHPGELMGYAVDLWRESRRVLRYCRERQVALVHAHSPISAMYGRLAARRMGVKMLVHVHDALSPRRQYRAVVRYITRVTSEFICVSHASQEMILQLGIRPDHARVLYNGVEPAFLGPRPAPNTLVDGPGPHIGIFALILPLKGQDVFLQAAAQLARQFPTARFYVVGGLAYADDQPYLDRLHTLASDPALHGRVTFPGFQNDVASWMMAMDAVVLASVEPEALPTVVTEAMALGRPVVGTDLGGTREIIEDGVTGYLVPPADPAALASRLAAILGHPNPALEERAARSIRERFAPEIFAANMREIYARLL